MAYRRFRHLEDDLPALPPDLEGLGGAVLGCVREVYQDMGAGLSEAVYRDALEMALQDAGLPYRHEPGVHVSFKGRALRNRVFPDFIVADRIVVELKAVEEFHPTHFLQIMTCLRATGLNLGYLVSFNVDRLSEGIKRRIWA